MFILNIIKTVPILLIINVYSNNIDSSLVYYNLGLENKNASKFESSEFYFKKAIDSSKDSSLIAKSYTYLGAIFIGLGKFELAHKSYLKAENYTENYELLAKIYSNRGVVNEIVGDDNRAILHYKKALEFTKDNKLKAFIYNNIAINHYKRNEFQFALEYYIKSLKIKEKIDHTKAFSTYSNIALCYQKLGNIKEAEYFFNKTIQERIRLFGYKHYRLIIAYINYGSFLINTKPVESFTLLSKANDLALLNYGKKHPETAKTYIYLGNYYNSRKEYYKALEQYQKALIANSKQFNNLDFHQNPPITNAISELEQLEILHKKAITFQKYAHISGSKQKELKTSLKTYELAVATLFKLQNSFMDESKRTLISNKKDMFAEAANVAIQLGNYPKAFQLIEIGKASTLLAAVNNNEAIKFGNIPDSLVDMENEYKRLKFVHSANDNTDSVLFYQAKHDSLIMHFEKYYPKYYNFKYRSHFIDPCKHLNNNQVLLEYAITDTLCTTLLITKEGYKHYTFNIDSTFLNNTEKFIYLLKNYNLDDKYREQYNQITTIGYYLWEKLIKPLNIPEDASLIIVPDGILSYINFEALLYELPEDTGMNYYLLKYLVYKYPISYCYSSRWLFEPFNKNPKNNIGAFAISYEGRKDVMSLPNSVPEAKKLTKSYNSRAFINENCTREAFLNNAADYKILHLSLHGDIDLKNSGQSKLVFNNENIYAWEVYGMNLNAQLAYLSACNTGDGILDRGEGIFSMGRAFAYAGCSTVIMSLWTEKDNLSHVTLDFYKYLRRGYSLDKAMQKAKINHLKQKHYAHPHYWSNKIIMGKVDALSYSFIYWIIGIVIVIILILIIKRIT